MRQDIQYAILLILRIGSLGSRLLTELTLDHARNGHVDLQYAIDKQVYNLGVVHPEFLF